MSVYKQAVVISSGQVEPNRPPPGLGFLAGVCANNNLPYEPFDLNIYILHKLGQNLWTELYHYTSVFKGDNESLNNIIDKLLDSFVETILEVKPDIVMITVLTYWQNFWTKKLLEKLKDHDVVTVAGGPGISIEYETNKTFGRYLCDNNLLDYYVLGEGDLALDQFLKNNIELGLNSKTDKFETWAPQIEDLNAAPFRTYKKINVEDYKTYDSSGAIAVTSSRGCVRRCTFCDVGTIWKKFRFRSAENVVKEIKQHYEEVGETNFFFTDSLINGSIKNFIKFMEEIVKLKETVPGFDSFRYSGQFIVRHMTQHPEYMYQLMQKSGYYNVQVGVETGSDRVRAHMQKKFTNADLDYHMEMCNKYGLTNTLLMLIGYPTETIEDFQESLDMIKRYQKYLLDGTLIDISDSLPLMVLKNTPLHDLAHELGMNLNDEYINLDWVADTNPDLTVKERWRRFIVYQRELIRLRYPRPAEMEIRLMQYIDEVKKLKE